VVIGFFYGIVVQRRWEKGPPIGPMLLAFSAWVISLPSALFGMIWCLSWIVPKSLTQAPIPEPLEYPFFRMIESQVRNVRH
jgi:hypothetical protein